jgi:hypothetical protein
LKLELFDRAFSLAKLLRDFAGASLLDVALINDMARHFGKLADKLKKARPMFDKLHVRAGGGFGRIGLATTDLATRWRIHSSPLQVFPILVGVSQFISPFAIIYALL